MKKVFAVFMLLCFLICLTPIRPAKADSFPSEFFVNSEVYYSASDMYYAYIDLNEVQREICAYLLGMYNLMYLGSRGFQFQAGAYQNESEFIAKLKSFGYRFLQGAAEIALKSRMNDDFCKYASACILYASQCNVNSFSVWFENLDDSFTLPVDQGLLNSFTLLYNDNSNEGIEVFGDSESPWHSGTRYPAAFDSLISANQSTAFLAFLDEGSDFLYSTVSSGTHYNAYYQNCFVSDNFPDTLFIQRGETLSKFRWGIFYNDAFHGLTFETFRRCTIEHGVNDSWVNISYQSARTFDASVKTGTTYNDLSDFIYYVFQNFNPVNYFSFNDMTLNGYYPFIRHVVLVDDITSLTNMEEIYNTDSWDLIGLGNNMIVPIDKVDIQPKLITTINLPDNTSTEVNIQDIINSTNTIDDNGDPVNPWQITIVVQPNNTNPISIDVNMFSSAKVYIQYLWENATSFLSYCKDLLDCFAFTDVNGADYGPKYALYGVIVLGVASGLIAKFLL